MSRHVYVITVDSPHDHNRTRDLLTKLINVGLQEAADSLNDGSEDADCQDALDLGIEDPL